MSIISIIAVILVFGTVIFIHEFGHFFTAKLFNVKVNEFSMGMGPCLFNIKKGETQYSLRLIPIGGYVKMEGEDGDSDDERSFSKKKPYQRLIILVAGAFMNFVLGLAVTMILYGTVLPQIPITKIESSLDGFGAQKAGIQAGDIIYKINGEKINNAMDISLAIGNEDNVNVTVIRNREKKNFNVELISQDGEKYLGIKLDSTKKTPLSLMQYSFNFTKTIIKLTYKSFFSMFGGEVSVNDMSGPVGIVTEIGNAAKRGIEDVLFLLIIITLNLGVVNLFPLPALDGGRAVFVIIEMITGKKLKEDWEATIHFIGFILLLLFMVYITKNDIVRLIKS